MKNTVYTVHAYRWGDRERHSYLVGVYSEELAALKCAGQEEDWMAGGYECEVIEWVPDTPNKDGFPGTEYKFIKRLEMEVGERYGNKR